MSRALYMAEEIVQTKLGEVSILQMKEYDIPLYSSDLEHDQAITSTIYKIKEQFKEADGVIFITAEHCSSLPACLKNLIDWVSRPLGKELKHYESFDHKPLGIITFSTGRGGVKCAEHLRSIAANCGFLIMPYAMVLSEFDKISKEEVEYKIYQFTQKFETFIKKVI